jgi:hypothetical protein
VLLSSAREEARARTLLSWGCWCLVRYLVLDAVPGEYRGQVNVVRCAVQYQGQYQLQHQVGPRMSVLSLSAAAPDSGLQRWLGGGRGAA